jgi:uncharacterized protein YjiS (DUF1127 family)
MVSTNILNNYAAVAQRLAAIILTHIHIQGYTMINLKEMWARLQERLAEERQARKTINELSKLTDYQLRDMGIHRSMIVAVARGEYHG